MPNQPRSPLRERIRTQTCEKGLSIKGTLNALHMCHRWFFCVAVCNLLGNKSLPKAPVTQNSTSQSRTRHYENLVDVVVSGNLWSILAWPCFVTGYGRRRLFHGLSNAQALPKHCLSTDKPLNTRYYPWYQRVTPVRWPCSARDRSLNFRVLPRLPKF